MHVSNFFFGTKQILQVGTQSSSHAQFCGDPLGLRHFVQKVRPAVRVHILCTCSFSAFYWGELEWKNGSTSSRSQGRGSGLVLQLKLSRPACFFLGKKVQLIFPGTCPGFREEGRAPYTRGLVVDFTCICAIQG